jgi:hypothetical protein
MTPRRVNLSVATTRSYSALTARVPRLRVPARADSRPAGHRRRPRPGPAGHQHRQQPRAGDPEVGQGVPNVAAPPGPRPPLLVQVGLGEQHAPHRRGNDPVETEAGQPVPETAQPVQPCRAGRDGDHDPVRGRQRRDGQSAEAGRQVQHHRVIAGPQPPQRPGDEGAVGGQGPGDVGQPPGGGQRVQLGHAGGAHRRGRVGAADDDRLQVDGVLAGAPQEPAGQVRLGVAVDRKGTAASASEPRRQVGRCHRLAGAAVLVRDCEDDRHRAPSPTDRACRRSRPPGRRPWSIR